MPAVKRDLEFNVESPNEKRSATKTVTLTTPDHSVDCLRIRSNIIKLRKHALKPKPMLLRRDTSQSSTKASALEEILTNCSTKAMRYYRIWIYTCNVVLLVSVLTFSVVASKVLVADYRRHLVPGLTMYQPSFLYAYFAIFTQSGVLQIVGCLGALRLSERLLNVYWLMLLMLLFGDLVIGIFWVFRIDKMLQELRPSLKYKFFTEYGHNPDATALWDRLQTETNCCGVQNALDFANMRSITNMMQWGDAVPNPDNTSTRYYVPDSCCALKEAASEVGNVTHPRCHTVYRFGCEERLRTYIKQTAETLFLIGYCVIAFVKMCFIGILRYEIREMIQKIKLLKTEMEPRASITSVDMVGVNARDSTVGLVTSPTHTVLIPPVMETINGTVRKHGGLEGGTESERESLLVNDPETPAHQKTLSVDNFDYYRKNAQLQRKLFPGDNLGDSESHCALLVDETSNAGRTPPNGNNNYEMKELQQQVPVRQHSRMSNPDTHTQNM